LRCRDSFGYRLTAPPIAFATATVIGATLSVRHAHVLQVQKLPRGVYWEAATVDGNPSAIAVNAVGDMVKRMIVENFTWKKGEATERFLWNFLNVIDPATTIGTVRPLFALAAPVQATRDPYDPYAEQGVPGTLRAPW
jgi:hypothetical protein